MADFVKLRYRVDLTVVEPLELSERTAACHPSAARAWLPREHES